MVVGRKNISLALVELGNKEPTTRDKWLTVDAWNSLLFTQNEFDSSINFTIREFSRALNLLGVIHSLKVWTGNHTGTHVREKCWPVVDEDGKNTGKIQSACSVKLIS